MAGVYQGTLKLDRVVGIRHDKNQRMAYVPVKKDETSENFIESLPRSKKVNPNVTNDGLKKS